MGAQGSPFSGFGGHLEAVALHGHFPLASVSDLF